MGYPPSALSVDGDYLLQREELAYSVARSLTSPHYKATLPTPSPTASPKPSSKYHPWFYWLVILALLFATGQSLRAIGTSVYKIETLLQKTPIVERYYQKATQENQSLKTQIKRYTSKAGIEELARNNLDMVGPGDILVRLY